MSLLKRMEQVLAMHPDWSARDWSRAAGLKEESHVNTILQRLRKDPNRTVSTRTLAALARSAGVSAEWLSTGRGTPTGSYVLIQPDPLYPTRAQAVAAARLYGWNADAIARVAACRDVPADPGLNYWRARLEAEHEAAIRALPAAATQVGAEPPTGAAPPPRRKRG